MYSSNPELAEKAAMQFFNSKKKQVANEQSGLQKIKSTIVLKYISPVDAKIPVYCYENRDNEFVLIAENAKGHNVIGYAESPFVADSIPPALAHLISLYEKNMLVAADVNAPKLTRVAPLLATRGINLNQFIHENAGGCWTGCVATAMAQIMAYHKYPQKGTGSHCYTDPKHGEFCADFGNTTYNWNNPTEEDYKLLSFHVGVAMDMQYCGSPYGSVPASPNYEYALPDYFKYHLILCNSLEYILNEIEKGRPVYCQLPGDPVGHAVVLDGFDENGMMHINFGWGGKWNGYFSMNTNDYIITDYLFVSNIIGSVFISPEVYKTVATDSLALVDIHNKLNHATGWDLTKPVYRWPGVLVINERVVELDINTFSTNTQGSVSAEIGKLTGLRKLSIKGTLSGTLPASIANLTKLVYLHIETNGTITGTLPDDIHKLSALKYLSLKKIITGNIPSAIGQLVNLTDLNLSGGSITGSIPNEICNLTKLNFLDLSRNQLTGNIPSNIGNLKNVNTLHLSDNKLSGVIPVSVGNLDSISYFSASNNQLSGSIPDVFSGCTKLETIILNNNQFSGDIPLSLINTTNKLSLEVSKNKLSRIPDSISNQSNIVRLNISENKFKTLPLSMNNLGSLKILYANRNQIDSLPEGFGFIKSLDSLNLSQNLLKIFPERICNIPALKSLILTNNKITRFPYSINSLSSKLKTLTIDNNDIRGPIPPSLLLRPFENFLLHQNYFRYEDIPDTAGIKHFVGGQKKIAFSKNSIPVSMGDTLRIDIRKIAPLSHPGNKYYWCRYPKYTEGWDIYNAKDKEKESPVLEIVIDKININYTYYCKIFNPSSPDYTSTQWGITDKCLPYLDTDTISFYIGSEEEILKNKYPELYVTRSENLPESTVQDGTVTLFAHEKVRGTLVWQASTDTKNWVDITANMTNVALKANIQNIGEKEIILKPTNTAWYRTKIIETACEPVYGDTIEVNAPGKVLYDQTINATKDSVIIAVDSIEIFVPKGFHDKDFRLTIVKLDKAPKSKIPNQEITGPVYDVNTSFGNQFIVPLTIKLKGIPNKFIADSVIPNIKPAYYDDVNRIWIPFSNKGLSLKDSSILFPTRHLTKISWYDFSYGRYYTDILEGKRVNVLYNYENESDYFRGYDLLIKKGGLSSWHDPNNNPRNGGNPYMIQDIQYFSDTIIARYERLGLIIPDKKFNIYVYKMGQTAEGGMDFWGQSFGYMLMNVIYAQNQNNLKQTLSHEFMHYLQDQYMISSLNNTFWMEANAPLASWIVFNKTELSEPESEKLLRETKRKPIDGKSLLDLIGSSWDNQDKLPVLEKFISQKDANVSSTFLHFMQHYRSGSKLDPVKLLTEHGWINSALYPNWRSYLDAQIKKQLSSTVGDEFDAFVKYIISGTNKNFCISDSTGNPFQYYIENANFKTNSWAESLSESVFGEDNTGTFARRYYYNFGNKLNESKTDNVIIPYIPHLSSKMVLIENHSDYHAIAVEYKRTHATRDFFKIYHGWYDSKTKTMKMIDISDSAKYSFAVQKKSMKFPEEFKEYAFLLFVNKSCPVSDFNLLESAHAAIFDLTVKPILDIESLEFLGFGDETLSKQVQLYDTGLNDQVIYFNGTNRNNSVNTTYYTTEKKMLNDSLIRIDVENNYYYENKLKLLGTGSGVGYVMPSRGNVRITQVIHYNIYKNTVKIEEIESGSLTILRHKDPFSENTNVPTKKKSDWTERKEIEIKLPENIQMQTETNDDYTFKTSTTEETKSLLIKAKHQIERKDYSLDGSATYISNYLSTDYSQATVKIWGRFRAEKPKLVIVSNP